MVPTYFRFSPTDEELVDILHQKASGNTIMAPLMDFIVECNIYEVEPQHLQWIESTALNKHERYYYCKRESDSREVTGRGWWKATSHVKTISAANGNVVGYKRPLTFHRFRDEQRKRKDAIKTDYIMHEYGLQSIRTNWKLCKIKYKGKEKLKADMMENTMNNSCPSMSSEAGEHSSSSSTNPILLEFGDQQQQPLVPINNNQENYLWSNPSNMGMFGEMNYIGDHHQQLELGHPSSLLDPSYFSMPYIYDIPFTQQQNQQPYDDLWS